MMKLLVLVVVFVCTCMLSACAWEEGGVWVGT